MSLNHVSIIIISKDRPERLRQLLTSLVEIECSAGEIILIDNGSTTQSGYPELCRTFEGRLPLKYFLEEEIGFSVARNRGAKEAKGEILAFVDDDCEVIKGWLENLVKPFEYSDNIGAVGLSKSYERKFQIYGLLGVDLQMGGTSVARPAVLPGMKWRLSSDFKLISESMIYFKGRAPNVSHKLIYHLPSYNIALGYFAIEGFEYSHFEVSWFW